jgi:signal peptidase II
MRLLYKNKMIAFSIILFVILDRFFKGLSLNHYFDQPTYIFKDIFSLNFIGNYNIAFSLPITGIFLNIIILIIIGGLIFSLLYSTRRGRDMDAIFLFAVILGAVSNFIDRLKYGYVIDYFDLKYFTVFNLADAMIVGGVTGLLWLIVKENKRRLNLN